MNRAKGYLNEVGRKQALPRLSNVARTKGYLNKVDRKLLNKTNYSLS